MVARVWRWFTREFSNLHEAALLLGVAAFSSQLLALIRDRLLATNFGASGQLDVYYTAFRLPDLVYATIASFVSVTVLIPYVVTALTEGDRERARRLLSSVLTAFMAVMVVAMTVVWFLLPWLAPRIAPGFDQEQLTLLVTYSRILLLSPLLLGLSNVLGAVTQSVRQFFVYAASPLLYNLGIIIGVVWLYPRVGPTGLVWGVVIGAFLHLAIQIPVVWRAGVAPRLVWRLSWSELVTIVRTSLPRTLALGAHQFTLLALVALASVIGAGAVSVFNFALNLQSVPLSIIGVSYSVAAFPTLARLFSSGQREEFLSHVTGALRHVLFWSLPATVMFIVLRAQIVRVILGSGSFDWTATRLTAAALALFVLSVAGQNLIQLFMRGYYACGRTRRPFVLNVVGLVVSVVTAPVLVWCFRTAPGFRAVVERILRVDAVETTAILMLPLAFSLGVAVNVGLYWYFFQKDFGRFSRVVDRALGQSALSSLVAGVVTYQVLGWLAPLVDQNTFSGIFVQGLVAGLAGLITLIIILRGFNNREINEIETSLRHKFWRTKPIAPDPEGL